MTGREGIKALVYQNSEVVDSNDLCGFMEEMVWIMFGKKKKETARYDETEWKPVLQCSICTGEQVAGFKNRNTGVFKEDCLVKNELELVEFKKKYGIKGEVEKIY